VTDIEEQSPRV